MRRKEDTGSTIPTAAYQAKKMNSPSQRFESEPTPQRSQPSYPGAYHPSTRLSATRSAGVRKRERGRLDAIAASGGKKAAERPRRIDTDRGPRARQSDYVGQTGPIRQKVKHPMGVVRRPRQLRQFRNHYNNYIGTHNAHCATTGLQRGKPLLQRFVCQRAHYGTMCQCGVDNCLLIEPHYCGIIQGHVLEGLHGERRRWPHLHIRYLS
jgi:hypothetical protein